MKLEEIKGKLTGELKDAIKGKDLAAKAVISVVSAKLTAVAKDAELKGKELLDNDLIGVFSQELKQVRESLVEAEKAAREDVVETCKKQIEFLEKFLPKQLSKEEIKTKVLEIIDELGLKVEELTKKDMGKIMGAANAKLKGQADGKEISSTVQELINK